MTTKKSSSITIASINLPELVKTCSQYGVKHIRLADVEIEFGRDTATIDDSYADVPVTNAVDNDADMGDNDTTYESGNADAITSLASLEDELENLALTDPLLYEEKIAQVIRQETDARD